MIKSFKIKNFKILRKLKKLYESNKFIPCDVLLLLSCFTSSDLFVLFTFVCKLIKSIY